MEVTAAPAWTQDVCPRPPLVLAGELALPPGGRCEAPRLVADVHVTGPWVTPAHRARALALCSPAGHGVLVRASSAWVWTGHPDLLPRHVDVGLPRNGPPMPAPRPGGHRRGLPLRPTRWDGPRTWALLDGVPLTDPDVTASDCARLLPEALARTCVQALARSPGLDLPRIEADLRTGGPRPGRRQALRLLDEVGGDPRPVVGDRPQSSATSRWTPLVTR